MEPNHPWESTVSLLSSNASNQTGYSRRGILSNNIPACVWRLSTTCRVHADADINVHIDISKSLANSKLRWPPTGARSIPVSQRVENLLTGGNSMAFATSASKSRACGRYAGCTASAHPNIASARCVQR
jgi:hypothetical protein